MRIPSLAFTALLAATSQHPRRSPHRHGPNGLEGWTPSHYDTITEEPVPTSLVLGRRGHVVREIQGGPFLWRWMFQKDGRQVAFESGPLHFVLRCRLVETRSGRELASYDCNRALPPDAPPWVKLLEGTAGIDSQF